MIKIALKHWIYELCINQMFENFSENLPKNKEPLSNVKHGERFKYITFYIGQAQKWINMSLKYYSMLEPRKSQDNYQYFNRT